METRKNRRGITEHFVKGRHLKLDDLKVAAESLGNRYLSKEYIPNFPRPELRVSRLRHDTNQDGLQGIKCAGGFKILNEDSLLWWNLAVGPDDIKSAERRLLEETYPGRTEEQKREQPHFLWQFATSPAFLETSRLGSYRFTFGVDEVLEAYSKQFCSGAQPIMQVFETVLYKQEVMYVVLVDSPANQKYPLLSDDPNAVCAYRDGCFIWRAQAMCEKHSHELIPIPDDNQMAVMKLHESDKEFYIWDNVAIALRMETGQVLTFDDEQLRKNLKFCKEGVHPFCHDFSSDSNADEFVRALWPNYRAPLERENSLQELLAGFQTENHTHESPHHYHYY